MAGRFAASIILSREEALDVLATLEEAAEALDGHLELTFHLDGVVRMLQDKLTDHW